MGSLTKITQNVVRARGLDSGKVRDTVYVGKAMIIGEIVKIEGDEAEIQVYESAQGMRIGEQVVSAGGPLSVEIGPGLLGGIYDGLGRPLTKLGEYIQRGVRISALSDKSWDVKAVAKKGQEVSEGDMIAVVKEKGIEIRLSVPFGVSGTILKIRNGRVGGSDVLATIQSGDERIDVPLVMRWPVHKPIPFVREMEPLGPMICGQRVVDVFFPIAQGGKATLPGGFGVGKTVLGHSLAEGSEAEIIVYVGCGERGNEMADLLEKFTGTPIMDKMVLIANTSNMPVAAREASIYTGATIAEFYRNMGYKTLLIADSTSRWAEALREISGSMGEMPGEKGFPAYMASRIARFYERSGRVVAPGKEEREGSLTIIGMVSPGGGDFSEPVTQASMQYTKALWALDPNLAYRRHFPAINWTTSYSKYIDAVEGWWRENVGADWFFLRQRALGILGREEEVSRMIQIVGKGALSDSEKLLLDIAAMLREGYLQQNAYDEVDSVSSPRKSLLMLELIFSFYDEAQRALSENIPLERIQRLSIKSGINQAKRYPSKGFDKHYENLLAKIFDDFDKLRREMEVGGNG